MNALKAYFDQLQQNPTIRRFVRFLQYAGLLLLIILLGESHPVSTNSFINLGYHLFAFVAAIFVWGMLVFGDAAIIFRFFKHPPPWLVFGFLFITLVATAIGRMEIDEYLQKKAILDQYNDDALQ